MSLQNNLRMLMREKKVNQSDISVGCNIPQPSISRILNEKTKEPRREFVVRIANFFGVPPESLYVEEVHIDINDMVDQIEALNNEDRLRLIRKLLEEPLL